MRLNKVVRTRTHFQGQSEKVVMRSPNWNVLDCFSTTISYGLLLFLQTFTLRKFQEIFKENEMLGLAIKEKFGHTSFFDWHSTKL